MRAFLLAAAMCATVVSLAPTAQADVLDVGTQTGTFTGATRGYYFTAPVDFEITGIRVVTDASAASQDVEILLWNQVPPIFSSTSSNFSSLFRATNVPGAGFISTGTISVSAGDIIGVLGSRGANSTNSYQGSDYISSILGNPVTLRRMGIQADLRNAPAANVWREPGFPNIGRVELQFNGATVPEPASLALLGLGAIGIALRRRRKSKV